MKKFSSIKKILAVFAVVMIIIPTAAFAAVFRQDTNVPAGEIIIGNLYLAGPNPIVGGNVQGDLYVAGGNVTITGKVEDDVLALGGNITITGEVNGDVRAMGGTVYIDSSVNGEVIASGGEVTIGPNARIRKDLVATGGNVVVDAQAKVFGSTKIESEEDEHNDVSQLKGSFMHFTRTGFWIGQLFALLGFLLVAAMIFGFFPNVIKKLGTRVYAKGEFWRITGLGLLILIVTPVVALLFIVTMVGGFLGALIIIAYIAYVLVSLVVSGMLFGEFMQKWFIKSKRSTPTWAWVLGGVVALHIVSLIPFIGWIVGLLFVSYAMGTTLALKWKMLKALK